ncbi:MAG: hypothetical protein ACI8R9_002896 [Paraglaciecola sp.]|jgi:hypothetical protein
MLKATPVNCIFIYMFDLTAITRRVVTQSTVAILFSLALGGCANHFGRDITEFDVVPPISLVQQVDDLIAAIKQAQALPLSSTLVVFDIDDTLLTATAFFGSDKWYDWQRGRALSPKGEVLVTLAEDQVNCLFDTLGIAFEIGVNQPTQGDMAQLVSGVENDVVILTARSDAYRAATMRELGRNQLDFTAQALTPPEMAYYYAFTHDGRTAEVSYANGVFMVKGMDKGVMLLDLLQRTGRKYDAVIFVDDKTHNITNMADALKSAAIDFYGFHYTRVDKTVTETEVAQAQATAKALKVLLHEHFPQRAGLIEKKQCAY